MVDSINQIRTEITATLKALDEESESRAQLLAIRGACRKFLGKPHPDFRNVVVGNWDPGLRDRPEFTPGFFVALGEYRSTVGFHLAVLASNCKIKVGPELVQIFPLTGSTR